MIYRRAGEFSMNRHAHRRFALLALSLVAVFLLSALAVRATPTPSVLLDDTAFISAPGFDYMAIQAFLDRQPGSLGTYHATLDGKPAPAAHVISVASLGEPIEINPKVLLTLLEVAAGVVSNPDPAPATVQHPFPFINQPHVATFESDLFAMGDLLRRSFVAYDPTAAPPIRLGNGRDYLRPPFPNAGTYALEVALGHLAPDSPTFERFIGTGGESFRATFLRFFGDPTSSISPQATLQATTPFLFKPFVGNFAAGFFLDHDTRSNVFARFDGTSNGGYDGHDGTDYSPMAPGNTVIAAADGIIFDVAKDRLETGVGVTWCLGYPYTNVTGMVIKHNLNGVQYSTKYWHLTTGSIGINPRTNQQFKATDTILRGETVGLSGNTGCSTGPHLHFGVQRNGQATDPYGWCGGYADPYTNFSEVLWAEAMTNPSPCNGVDAYQGEFAGQSFQGTMMADSTQQVQIQLKNTGTATWDGLTRIVALPRNGGSPFYDPSWIANSRIMAAGSTPPGSIATFTFTIKAPPTPGQYKIDFAFVQDGVMWFNAPSDGFIWFGINVTPTVGSGSSRWPLFVEAFNRNGGTATLGYPSMIVQWSGPQNAPVQATIQGFSGGAFFIIHDEQKDTPPNSVPAYVLGGPILQHFQSLQGSSSWLGAGPSSDQFTNALGQQQSNFPNGYITWDGTTAAAHAWPVRDVNQWYAEYHNGTNLNAAATWIQNEASISNNWSTNAPGNGQWGVWSDHFAVRWTRRVNFNAGDYTFIANADDSMRVWIDDTLLIDAFLGEQRISQSLSAGDHDIRVEFIEGVGGAAADFRWEVTTPVTPTPVTPTPVTPTPVTPTPVPTRYSVWLPTVQH